MKKSHQQMIGLDEYVIRKKIIESKTTKLNTDTSKSKTSETVGKTNEVNIEKPKSVHELVVPKPKINKDKVIIEDWYSDDKDDVSEVNTVSPVKTNETQIIKTQVDKIGQISQKEGIGFKKIKALCLVVKPVWDNAKRVNHQKISNKLKYPQARRTFVPSGVLTKTGLVNPFRPNGKRVVHTVNTARPISTARTVSTVRPFAPKIAQTGSAIRPIYPRMDNGNPEICLQDHAVVDSGCSSHMTGNKAYLSDYEDYNGGFVAFGSDPKGGKITGKGKIRTANLDFDDVYFVDELKFNLFSVSQMCDKKNSVLFTDTECLILSPSFKLLDENQVVLRAPRQNGVYSLDLKNIVPSGGITCLYANATTDESKLWHRRLGHVNFKNINKLVKGHLVRGLPSKVFVNDHTCVACKKGKQHKASCKAKLERTIRKPLELLHMDLFGPVSVESINKKKYCLVVTDDFSRFSWVFFLATKDETNEILYKFITGLENQLNHKVKIIRSDHGTEFKNHAMNEFCAKKGIKREFSVARTPQQNGVAERKNRTLIEAARTMLADSLLPILFYCLIGYVFLKFNSIKDAKKLLEAVEKRFGGNAATRKTQRNLLKQQYENFTAPSSKMLDQTFDRLQKLVSQLELLDEKLSQEDVNQKLLRSLSPEWNTHAVVWRNKANLDTMSMDDLYNNLKVYEPEVKGMSSSSSSTQNMAFEENLLLMAMRLLVLISPKWSATTATRGDILLGSAELQEIKTTRTRKAQEGVCLWKHLLPQLYPDSKVVMKYDDALIIEGMVSDDEEEDVSQPKNKKKTVRPNIVKKEFIKSKQPEKSARKIVKQVEQHRQNTHSPRGNQRNWNNMMLIAITIKTVSKSKYGKTCLEQCSKVNTARQVNAAHSKTTVNAAIPMSYLSKTAHSTGIPQMDLQDQGVIDSGFSRHMAGNMSYLTDYEEIDGGYVAFGGNLKRGKITRKCTIKTVAERRNKTLIEAAKTMLANSKLPTTFWAEAVNTACYVQNRVLVVKPHNKTPYELFHGRTPTLSFMRPFGYPVTILNTIDHLDKFDGKADEGFFVGYSLNSKAFRVFNSRTRIVEEKLHIRFSKSTRNVIGSGSNWLFDIDTLTRTMNYEPIVIGAQSNGFAGTKASDNASQASKATEPVKNYILLPLWTVGPLYSQDPKSSHDDGSKPSSDDGKKVDEDPRKDSECNDQEKEDNVNSTNTVNAAGTNEVNAVGGKTSIELPFDPNMPALEDYSIFDFSNNDEDDGAEADMNNLDTIDQVSPIPTTRIHKDHLLDQVIRDFQSATQTIKMSKNLKEHGKNPKRNKKDERGIMIRNKARLVAQGYTQEEGIDYDEVFTLVARIETTIVNVHIVVINDLQHFEQSESISNTCAVETGDSMSFLTHPDNVYALQNKQTEFERYKAFNDCTVDYDKLERKLTDTLGLLAQKDMDIQEGKAKKSVRLMMKKLFGMELELILFWSTVVAKTIIGQVQLHALVDGKKIIITILTVRRDLQLEDAEGSAIPTDPHHIPTIIQSLTQPQKTQKPRKPKRKDTQVPQPSNPSKNVADEAVQKELGDSLVRAATTDSSLEAEQDSGNITKTRSKATPNESGSQGTNSGGGPGCQETMGDTTARTRFESVSKHSNDSLLARGNTLRNDVDRLKINESMELCTILQTRVFNLEKTKTTQQNKIDSLKRRVKKLENKRSSRTHKLKRLYKVSLSDRIESSKYEESLGEDASKEGRINAIDADEEITLVNIQDDAKKEMFDLDALNGEEVFVVGKNENVVEEVVDTAQVSTAATTITITTEEITLAQALEALKTSKPKVKWIVFQDPGKSTTITTISSQQSSNKGKGILVESEKPMKKKDLIRLDEETALKLQAEFDEEERLAREKAKKEKEANIALIKEWDDIQSKIDADHQLAERLQAQEQEELSDAEKATLFQQLLEKRRKHFAAKRA
ncbi:putative ribonuclease H-like domain-containing protein [Tanacetum coccineum]